MLFESSGCTSFNVSDMGDHFAVFLATVSPYIQRAGVGPPKLFYYHAQKLFSIRASLLLIERS
jgi:hypothetical protein